MVENTLHGGAVVGTVEDAATEQPSLVVRRPYTASGNPRKRHRRDSETDQFEVACKMWSRQAPLESICGILGWSEKRVKRILYSKAGRDRVDELRGKLIREQVDHHYELVEMLPKARRAIRDGLENGPIKLQTDTAKWLHGALIQAPVERKEVSITGKLEHDLSPVLETIGRHLSAIREANQGQDVLGRVKRGDEVLIRPQLGSGEE